MEMFVLLVKSSVSGAMLIGAISALAAFSLMVVMRETQQPPEYAEAFWAWSKRFFVVFVLALFAYVLLDVFLFI